MKGFAKHFINSDNGKHKKLLKKLDIKDECVECYYFSLIPEDNRYKCNVMGSCPGCTLSLEFRDYLMSKLDVFKNCSKNGVS